MAIDRFIVLYDNHGYPIPLRLTDINGDQTAYAISSDAVVNIGSITLGTVAIDQTTAHANEVVLKSLLTAVKIDQSTAHANEVVLKSFLSAVEIDQATAHANEVVLKDALVGLQYNGVSWSSVWGVSAAPVTSANMSAAAVAVTDAPTTGQKIVIDQIIVSADTDMRLTFTCETSGAVLAYVRCPAKGTVPVSFVDKLKLATADKKVMCQSSVSGNVEVLVAYHSEA